MTKKILLLGSGELGKEFVIAAQRLGQYVIACDSYAGAPAMQVADACEVFSMLDGDALDRVVMLAVQQQMPLDEDFAARNRLQLVQRAQIGGFARAGRANQADNFTLFDLQVDVLQDFQLAVMFGNMLRFQHERFLIFHRDTSLFVHREFLLDFVEDEREQRGDNQIKNQRSSLRWCGCCWQSS